MLTRREFVTLSTVAAASAATADRLIIKAFASPAREIPSIIDPDWLASRLGSSGLIVVDIRSRAQYDKGHIEGSLNIPMSKWSVSREGLSMELPADQEIRTLLGSAGLTETSHLVVVNRTETDFHRADATRVAWTCLAAGLKNVAVLNGGFNRWVKEKRPVSTIASAERGAFFEGKIDRSSLVSKEELLGKIGRSIILDTRVPEDYFGILAREGHIRTALNLPAPWVFDKDGSYRNPDDISAMAAGVAGTDKSKEIVVYCGVGGFAATWWLLLTQQLGYTNVRLYDGSIEDWMKDPAGPVSSFSWK